MAVVPVRRIFLDLFGTGVVGIHVCPDSLHFGLFHHALNVAFGFVKGVVYFCSDSGALWGDLGGEFELLGGLVGGFA